MTQSMVIGYNPIKNMVIGKSSGVEDMRIISLSPNPIPLTAILINGTPLLVNGDFVNNIGV